MALNNEIFSAGFEPTEYINQIRNYRSFVRELNEQVEVEQAWVDGFAAERARLPNVKGATFMSEDWCGDAACNLPVLAKICERAELELRVIRGSEQPELNTYYEDDGTDHIPVFSIWDTDFNEIIRWVEAPKGIQEKKDEWKGRHPEFMELYEKRETDKEAAKQFAKLYMAFLVEMAAWYRDGGWKEVCDEITALLRAV